jgi:hypothetical protein
MELKHPRNPAYQHTIAEQVHDNKTSHPSFELEWQSVVKILSEVSRWTRITGSPAIEISFKKTSLSDLHLKTILRELRVNTRTTHAN